MLGDIVPSVDVQVVDEKLALDRVRAGESIDQLIARILDPGREARI